MKLRVLYHKNDQYTSEVEQFIEEFKRVSSGDIELLDLETPEGASVAAVYDAVNYPALLVVRDDGQLNKGWQGPELPAVQEVVGYLNN
jgi:hypothetical protein